MSRIAPTRARLWVTLATVVGVTITASLGFWQLGRAEMKENLAAQRQARAAMSPAGWREVSVSVQPAEDGAAVTALHDRPVVLRGRWLHEATVFLDNRPMSGRSGFFVVTPLLSEDGRSAVAVQRGWVPRRMDDRTAVPELPMDTGVVEVVGRLAPPPSMQYELGQDSDGRIRQNIDLSSYGAQWSLRLPPLSVQQTEGGVSDASLLREWPQVGADVHKHYGYATQWFGLSALMVFLYVWFQFIAPRRRSV